MEFLKNNKRFSFKLDGINCWETDYSVKINEKENEIVTEYLFDGKLKITNIAKKYPDFNGYEWVNYIENISNVPTGIISELWDCDCAFPIKHEDEFFRTAYIPDSQTATRIFAPKGSLCEIDEFTCDADRMFENYRNNHLRVGKKKNYATKGGRSCEDFAPFFNVHKDGTGYFFAVGWTGQWNAEIERETDRLIFRSKIEDTNFKVLPGEKFHTSSVVVMAYEADVTESHNKWRRFIKKHFSLIGQPGREKHGPLCAKIWGGMKSELVLDRIEKIKKNKFPYEYVWMDAGWYGENTTPSPDEFEGDWYIHVGDWRVSKNIFPNGLEEVSKAIHDAGMKFLLWLEPERAKAMVPAVQDHPEYFLSDGNEKNTNRLLNLGNPEAFEYIKNILVEMIEKLKVDCYRQDFNFYPLDFWRNNDADDRRGITEIKHINGLYKLWDILLDKFPNLLIDNCSGGGRRLDIEMFRRSIPLWRSDFQCAANYDIIGSQCHNISFNTWMPYSGTSTARGYDEYRIRSSYGAALASDHSFSAKEEYVDIPEKIEFLKKYLKEYLKIRPYFSEDFYSLTQFSDKEDTWCATQFNRPSEKDGMIQVFRREKSPYETATFELCAINENADYLFTDLDGGEFKISGKALKEKGFEISLKEKRKAKIFVYKEL